MPGSGAEKHGPANHRTSIINGVIAVSALHIGWFLLPSTPLARKHSVCRWSTPVGLRRPTGDTFLLLQYNLIRVAENCNQGVSCRPCRSGILPLQFCEATLTRQDAASTRGFYTAAIHTYGGVILHRKGGGVPAAQTA